MVNLKITTKYCIAFYFIIMLYVSLHELVHHFTGALICGDWGYKSFNHFKTACDPDDNRRLIATFAGPIFTYIMMYVGAHMLLIGRTNYRRHYSFALIFAQLPVQRMTGPFFKMNDEYYAAVRLWGRTEEVYWVSGITLIIICIPPLVVAYKSIKNKNRLLWFLFYALLFPYLLWGPIFGALEYLMVNEGILNQQIIGIGLLFIINETITIWGHWKYGKQIVPD